MAGRGTDIKLGEGVKELGGLAVLGSERHESRRIDNQLRGRSGRQGDPGYSRFYVSLEDELMVRFGSDRMQGLFNQMGDMPIENKTVSKAISSAQKRVEGINFDARKALLDYDDVMRLQRETMYEQRNYILEHDDIHSVIDDMYRRVMGRIVGEHTTHDGKKDVIDYKGIVDSLKVIGSEVKEDDINNLDVDECVNRLAEITFGAYNKKIDEFKDQIKPLEKTMVLRTIDRAWVNHIDVMSKLRDGIGLRSYAQNNPLQAYVEEGYELFETMMNSISDQVVVFCNNVKIERKDA